MKSPILVVIMLLFSGMLLANVSTSVALAQYDEEVGGVSYETDTGLVACEGIDCNLCSLIQTANNIITWLITALSIMAVIGLVVAGFRLVTSRGNQQAMERAKAMFGNVIIGFILVLAAWLIVDTLLLITLGSGLEVWGTVECGGMIENYYESDTYDGSFDVDPGDI